MVNLAQMNVARLIKPLDHPDVADFVNNLDRINYLAEQSPGFIWRLQDESGNATAMNAFNDPLLIVNMSVWESVDALRDFAFGSEHAAFVRRRREWFEKHAGAYQVLWWIPMDYYPSIQEGKIRLQYLRKNGESPFAFTFVKAYSYDAKVLT